MSDLTTQDIERIATLARIEIDPEDVALLLRDLASTLDLFEQLRATDTAGVEPMTHPGDGALRLREDRVSESDQRAAMQAVAPRVEAGLYLVPRVIE
jgi:aspartyl-tRNA(Asn)/glutamyl-tRNA(Gln) amidotransferase subunit C